MTILGFDPGYGDDKVAFGDTKGTLEKLYKFNSVVGSVETNDLIKDSRVYNYKGGNYYVGPLALNLESSRIIDILQYDNLEYYAPLLIQHTIVELGSIPEVIVCGLSIAHIEHSSYFKEALEKHLIGTLELPIKRIEVIPQGIGGKITFDKYGAAFPSLNTHFADNSNYIGCDIGFNTIDIFQVLQNRTSPNLIRGIEHQGVVKIVRKLQDLISAKYNMSYSIKECKEILDQGFFKVRGEVHNLQSHIEEIKAEYLKEVIELIEANFGKVLDKSDKLRMFGGGSYIFRDTKDDFIEVPKSRAEYYNAIGNYLHGIKLHEGMKSAS